MLVFEPHILLLCGTHLNLMKYMYSDLCVCTVCVCVHVCSSVRVCVYNYCKVHWCACTACTHACHMCIGTKSVRIDNVQTPSSSPSDSLCTAASFEESRS